MKRDTMSNGYKLTIANTIKDIIIPIKIMTIQEIVDKYGVSLTDQELEQIRQFNNGTGEQIQPG